MPELPFVQVMAASALAAIAAAVLAIPAGARLGARTGRLVLQLSLVGVLAVFAGCGVWGASTGDLARFNAAMGAEVWLQLGLFFGIVYGTGYRFVGAYLSDKQMKEAGDA